MSGAIHLTDSDIDAYVCQRLLYRQQKLYTEADKILYLLNGHGVVCGDDDSWRWKEKEERELLTHSSDEKNRSSRARKLYNKRLRRKGVKSRGRDFAEWVLQTFEEYLTYQCELVLDIAGGKGEVSYYISSRCSKRVERTGNLECRIIDPAMVCLSPSKTKHFVRHNISHGECVFPEDFNRVDHNFVYQFPESGKRFIHADAMRLKELVGDIRVLWLDFCSLQEEAKKLCESTAAKEYGILDDTLISVCMAALRGLDRLNIRHFQGLFDSRYIIPQGQPRSGTTPPTLLLGLHPDEATEDIIDSALTQSIPFAVVPCCVFPSKFPNRRTATGTQVRSFVELIEYLHQKDSRIKRKVIDTLMWPNNIVLYMLPTDFV